MERRPRLLFCAYPVGYGPAAKALVLASLCREAGFETVFVGQGSAHELVSRSEGIFDDVVCADAGEDVSRGLVGGSRAVVSIMDREFAFLAHELSRPLHVVDSLYWMRDRVPEAFAFARHYWVQDFPGVHEEIPGLSVPPVVIGPVVDVRPLSVGNGSGKLLISLGGFEASDDADRDRVYGELVLRAIETSRLATQTAEVTVIAGARTVRTLHRQAADCGVEIRSLPHEAALDELATATTILAAPGLTTLLESFRLGCATLFLPPRNYSQWCILKTLRVRRLAPHALHWEDLSEKYRLSARAPESERNPQVREAIDRLAGSAAALEALSRHLTNWCDIDRRDLAIRQHEFFKSLGPNGASAITTQLSKEFLV
jgi:hypothetical protein